jgi:single-strand selective monofunctional uracil DNA glycosylase
MTARKIIKAADELAARCEAQRFPHLVYNPLRYAREAHCEYLRRFASPPKRVLFWGMNPGPWGMAQTGIPFGEVEAAREFIGIRASVGKPDKEHPRYPVRGFDCLRSEVSGRRLWALFRGRYKTAARFFADNFVLNYCPLLFIGDDGKRAKNLTPDKLPRASAAPLFAACDDFLQTAVLILRPRYLVGVGKFAEGRLRAVFANQNEYIIGAMTHPSPANPAANRGFAVKAAAQLSALGAWQEEN